MWIKFVLFSILAILLFPLSSFADDGYFGENPGLDFYSMVDDGAAKMTDWLIKQRLWEYTTFAGFGRTCRTSAPWFDNTPMNEQLLQEVSNGIYTRLMMIASSKNVILDSDSLAALAGCLVDAYRDVQTSASGQQWVLERLGSLWLYTDGDASNSDYDIIVDIDKINKLIFSEDLKYSWTKNMAKSSFADLLAGKPIRPLFGNTGNTNGTGSTGNGWSWISNGSGGQTSWTTTITLSSLGLGSICKSNGGSDITSVDNLVNWDFLTDLSSTLAGGNNSIGNVGANYGNPSDASGTGWNAIWVSPTSSSDFYDRIPCDSIFCIEVQMISGNQNLLGGGQNKSIEGILDRHLKLMEPIADSNLAGQKMTNNSWQLDWTNLKFANIIPKPLLYISNKPQVTRQDKKDDTPASKDAKLQAAYKCAMYSAWLPSDPNIANSVIGWSYSIRNGTTPTNVGNVATPLGPIDTDQAKTLDACLDVALSQWRMAYYNSFSTDLTNIGTFTAGMIEEINNILQSWIDLDNKPSQ